MQTEEKKQWHKEVKAKDETVKESVFIIVPT